MASKARPGALLVSPAGTSAQNARIKVAPLPLPMSLQANGDTTERKPAANPAVASVLARRFDKDRTKRELTKKDEDNAVGDWLFGRGGLRGLAINSGAMGTMASEEDAGSGGAEGLVMSPKGADRKSHHGASRIDMAMEKYHKQTNEMHRKQEAAASSRGTSRRPSRGAQDKSLKARLRRLGRKIGRKLGSCAELLCNGHLDQGAGVPPITLSGIYRKVADAVGATQAHLKKLKAVFQRIDFDEYGNISLMELFEYLGETPSPIAERLYIQLVESQSGTRQEDMLLTYEDFLLFTLVFGLLSEEEILKFVFETFDADDSGHLEEGEVRMMLSVLNNEKPMYPGNFTRMIQEFDTDNDGRISLKEFKTIHKKYPAALFPVFHLHDVLQRKTLGSSAFVELGRNTAHLRSRTEAQKALHRQAVAQAADAEEGKEGVDDVAAAASSSGKPLLSSSISQTKSSSRPKSGGPATSSPGGASGSTSPAKANVTPTAKVASRSSDGSNAAKQAGVRSPVTKPRSLK